MHVTESIHTEHIGKTGNKAKILEGAGEHVAGEALENIVEKVSKSKIKLLTERHDVRKYNTICHG